MALWLYFVLLLPLGIGVVALVIWAVRRARTPRFDVAAYPRLARLGRLTLGARYVGVVLTLPLTGLALAATLSTQSLVFLVATPGIAGSVIVIAMIVGEVVAFDLAREPGVATLERRRLRPVLPVPLLIATALAAVLWLGLALGTRALVDPTGRYLSFTVTRAGGSGCVYTVELPAAGSASAAGLASGAVCLVLAALGTWLVARRPRSGTDPAVAAWDDGLRRRNLLGYAATVFGVVTSGIAITAPAELSLDIRRYVEECAAGSGWSAADFTVSPRLLWYGWFGGGAGLASVAVLGLVGVVVASGLLLGATAPRPVVSGEGRA
ncbi:MAG: hypothetical protein LBI33_05710 [Propionibacteriaceae bacterium]|jgi:hypothetical protein|nr:hypothetical protein [Propionibacteriaceae bacterium]